MNVVRDSSKLHEIISDDSKFLREQHFALAQRINHLDYFVTGLLAAAAAFFYQELELYSWSRSYQVFAFNCLVLICVSGSMLSTLASLLRMYHQLWNFRAHNNAILSSTNNILTASLFKDTVPEVSEKLAENAETLRKMRDEEIPHHAQEQARWTEVLGVSLSVMIGSAIALKVVAPLLRQVG